MKFKIILIISLTFLITNNTFSQKEVISLKQRDIKTYKINSGIYNFWSHNSNWGNKRGAKKVDTLPYFIDEKEYKGLVNYGLECFMVDKSRCIFSKENFKMYFLDINFEHFKFNRKDSIVNIKGTVRKGWNEKDHLVIKNKGWIDSNNVNIYIGEKKDTISKLYYEPWLLNNSPDKFIFTLKKERIKDFVVLDSFPAFYMKNYVYYETNAGSDRQFEISAKVNANSILTFGLEFCYSEIFEIGKLVFDTKDVRRNKRKKRQKEEIVNSDFKFIIRNDVQELYKNNITPKEKTLYYKITETAEDYLVKRQYGKANFEYKKLLKNNHYTFARDIHNAVRTAVISRDYETTISWCEKLILKGIPLSYFNTKLFDKLRKTAYWSEFLLKLPLLKEQHIKGLNQTLITGLEELVAMDQKDYARHAKGEFERSKLYDTTERVNDELIKLLLQEGFPTEEKIGVKMLNDSIPRTSPEYFVLIAHANQANGTRLGELKKIISKSVQNRLYDSTRSNLSELMDIETCFTLYKGNLYYDKSCGLVNKKQLQLIDFSFNNKFGFIIDVGRFAIIAYNKKSEIEDEIFLKEGFNFVKKITDDLFEDE